MGWDEHSVRHRLSRRPSVVGDAGVSQRNKVRVMTTMGVAALNRAFCELGLVPWDVNR